MRRWILPVLGVLAVALAATFLYWLAVRTDHAAEMLFVRPAQAKAMILEHVKSKGLDNYTSVEFEGTGRSYLRAKFKYDHEPHEYTVVVESKGIHGDFQVLRSYPYRPATESTYEAEE